MDGDRTEAGWLVTGSRRHWQSNAGYCDGCQKKTYWTRRQARAAARAIDKSMSAYACGNFWHIGHLPKTIVLGWEGRAQFRQRSAEAKNRFGL